MSCQEETVQARRDKVPARDAGQGEAGVKGEAAWAARIRPVRAGFAHAPSAATRPPTWPGSPALRELVPSAAQR